jgi:PAS domain S-box-containing protein
MLWLYLLGAVNVLIIALRRVLRRQKPLTDQLYFSRVAIDHVQSGVAWITADGKVGSINPSFARSLDADPKGLVGKPWNQLFASQEASRLQEAHDRMLLSGIERLDAAGPSADGRATWFEVVLVAVHDHKMRLVGHHCLVRDCTRERELETETRELKAEVASPC